MSMVEDLQRVLEDARALVRPITAADLSTPTPCEGWDVKGLLGHMTDIVQTFAAGVRGEEFKPAAGTSAAEATDIQQAYGQGVDALLAAARAPGALDGTVAMPGGPMPTERALAIALADQMIHSWDIAKALGKPFQMDDRMAAGTLRGLHHILTPERRGPGKAFAAEVPCPADAPAQDRLLAFTGRQP
jgi:uncharacterized protein (TIGR03086 family)